MLEQFSSGVLEELDYRGETYNALQLAKNMEGLPGIHVPVIYTELSTSKIITQEFVEGVKVSDVEAIEAAGLDREEIARNALRALIKQLPVDGFFHADPHPGNLLVEPRHRRAHLHRPRHDGRARRPEAPAARPADDRRPAGQRGGHGVGAARHERPDRRRGGREGVPAGLRAPDGPLHGAGPGHLVRADRQRGVRAAARARPAPGLGPHAGGQGARADRERGASALHRQRPAQGGRADAPRHGRSRASPARRSWRSRPSRSCRRPAT